MAILGRNCIIENDDAVVVDAGAFDGDTVLDFIKHKHSYKRIYAFEPDKNNFELLKRT